MIQDSGDRHEFDSGAVRDMQEGKGDFSLVPMGVLMRLYTDRFAANMTTERFNEAVRVMDALTDFQQIGEDRFLLTAMAAFARARGWTFTEMMLEVSVHFTEGAKKYGPYNWQKGIPTSSYFSSAVRHLLKWMRGDEDERHDRAFVWNCMCAVWTMENKPEYNDMPRRAEEC